MKIRSITFTQRFNMGNYEHIEISAVAEVEEQEAADTAMQSLKTFVQTALNKKVEEKTAPAPVPVVHDTTPIEVAVEAPKKEKKAKKAEKGIFGRLGDKISAGLFKASKMNQNNLQK